MCKMKKRSKRIYQGFAILIALTVTATGLSAILAYGQLNYLNWRGAIVFAPFAIVGGLLFLYVAIFKWDKMIGMK